MQFRRSQVPGRPSRLVKLMAAARGVAGARSSASSPSAPLVATRPTPASIYEGTSLPEPMLAPLDSAKRISASTSPPAKPSFAPPLVHYPSSNVSTYSAANRSDTVGRKRKEPMPSPQLGDASLYSRPCVQVLHDQAHESMSSSPSSEPSSDLQLQPRVLHVQASMPNPSSPSFELRSASQLHKN